MAFILASDTMKSYLRSYVNEVALDETYSEGRDSSYSQPFGIRPWGSQLISCFALIDVSGSLIASAGCNLR